MDLTKVLKSKAQNECQYLLCDQVQEKGVCKLYTFPMADKPELLKEWIENCGKFTSLIF